jgi:hypothetical protein
MIKVISRENWDSSWDERQKGSILIDLRKCESKPDILKAIGHNLRGQDSPIIHGNSLAALVDVMSDWFCENWGKKKVVYITGGNRLFGIGRDFAMNLTQCFNDAFEGAIYDRSLNHNGEGIHEEIGNVSIFLGLT